MLPVPDGVPHAAPVPLGVQVQVKLASGAGRASFTCALVTSEGPALVTTIVYVRGAPGTYGLGVLALLMVRFACGPAALVSVALLFSGNRSATPAGGVTVAVFVNVPVVAAGTVPVTVNVAVVPTGSVTSASMFPPPDVVPHCAPVPLAAHVQVKLTSGAGRASCTCALVTSDGPAFLTTMV